MRIPKLSFIAAVQFKPREMWGRRQSVARPESLPLMPKEWTQSAALGHRLS